MVFKTPQLRPGFFALGSLFEVEVEGGAEVSLLVIYSIYKTLIIFQLTHHTYRPAEKYKVEMAKVQSQVQNDSLLIPTP